MFNKENHLLYITLQNKYQNPIFPELATLLYIYLKENPTKIKLYLNTTLSLEHIKSPNILQSIINQIEGETHEPTRTQSKTI